MKIKPREPAIVSEYESGWYVEQPDYSKPLESCAFIEVAGPFKEEWEARDALQAFLRARRRAR